MMFEKGKSLWTVYSTKEIEMSEAEVEYNNANVNARHAESSLASVTSQLKQKKEKMRGT